MSGSSCECRLYMFQRRNCLNQKVINVRGLDPANLRKPFYCILRKRTRLIGTDQRANSTGNSSATSRIARCTGNLASGSMERFELIIEPRWDQPVAMDCIGVRGRNHCARSKEVIMNGPDKLWLVQKNFGGPKWGGFRCTACDKLLAHSAIKDCNHLNLSYAAACFADRLRARRSFCTLFTSTSVPSLSEENAPRAELIASRLGRGPIS